MSKAASAPAPAKKRVAALDQFRGYTMAGMFFVNFVGGYAAVHPVFAHHRTYCSYADTIMPGFFFALGFAFRLTYLRRAKEGGRASAIRHALWRNAKLILIALLFYNFDEVGEIRQAFANGNGMEHMRHLLVVGSFQPLMHLAFASIWILPVIGLSTHALWGWMLFSCLLHITNLHFFYYDYAHNHVIDGGILGFIGWSIPTLMGAIVWDVVRANPDPRAQWHRMGWWAAGLMLLGYGMACLNLLGAPAGEHTGLSRFLVEPPFVPPSRPVDMWTMDQQIASPSYMVFGAGLSLGLYLLFVLISDAWGHQVGLFRTFGKNPLFGYVYHTFVSGFVGAWLVHDSPLWMIMLCFAIYFAIVWATLRFMEYKGWFWKL